MNKNGSTLRQILYKVIIILAMGIGLTAEIHESAWKGEFENLKSILKANPEYINLPDYRNSAPLHFSADGGHFEIAEYLLKNGADPNTFDLDGDSPLHWAAFAGHLKIVKLLIQYEIDINHTNYNGQTALYYAVFNKHNKIVDYLLDHEITISDAPKIREKLLHQACSISHERLANLLIKSGCSIHSKRQDGGTLLHSAAEGNLIELTKMLEGKGVEIARTDYFGKTPADVAFQNNFDLLTAIYRDYGIEPDKPTIQIPKGNYLGQNTPGEIAELFAPGIISQSDHDERDICFSPDQSQVYFTRYSRKAGMQMTIFTTKQDNSGWSLPKAAPFSGEYEDAEAFIDQSGSKLYFISKRPSNMKIENTGWDMWFTTFDEEGNQGLPSIMGDPFSGVFYPTMTDDGTIYFTSKDDDIYYSKLENKKYLKVQSAGDHINTAEAEYNSFVSPDGSYLIYTSFGKEDTYGNGDLYISFKTNKDSWSDSKNLGEAINSEYHEFCPSFSRDGKHFFFTSNRYGSNDIFWLNTNFLEILRSQNKGDNTYE